MGLFIDGVWHDQSYVHSKGGAYEREPTSFRSWITADGSPGPSGEGGFKAEPGRYHLYVSYACPWAHRTILFRALKGLRGTIGMDVVHPHMGEFGWTFDDSFDGATGDTLYGQQKLGDIYLAADPKFTGRVTTPTLWDKERETIVSNESSEIIRMFNAAFDGVGATGPDYYPAALRKEIDAVNELIYPKVNNGVYRCGFAGTQPAYERAFATLFGTLDELEARLGESRYLVGDTLTEADWRFFVTLVRFDPVYVGHFKCNLRRIEDYPNLSNYLRELYQIDGVAGTVRFDHIKTHYYTSHPFINPNRIVPAGPEIDYTRPHDRARL